MRQQHPTFKQSQTITEFLLGPIKIKDGLFMGDQFAAKDIEFIISNKVTHVINTVSKCIPNLYERFGIQYLSVHWTEKEENIFDKKNSAVNAIFEFVEEAMEAGESCLIHSMHGKSRACAVLVAYLMRKYSWSLNKCLEFVNAKKEGLDIRNSYLLQMQELEKRIMGEGKLSVCWNQIKNQDDLILANTFYNAKKIEVKAPQQHKKTGKKRVAWSEKLVQKPVNMAQTMGAISEQLPSSKKVRSILKGDQSEQVQKEQTDDFQGIPQAQLKSPQDRFISTINGNIVHVTVNNFITTDKPGETSNKVYNTRPYSSDAKEREKKLQGQPAKLFPYDSNMSSTFKNPYQTKLIGKIGANIKGTKKKEQLRNPLMIYERPISAKAEQKKKGSKMVPSQNNPLVQKLGYDMIVTNSAAKRRYPSTNPKEDAFKWK